jgi:2-polyprenyl-6-methoxyphenol hydroxylase-like FAD-dependent oxidoreductase
MRVACVGGGPAGLYFALLMKMREPEHDITVFERSPAYSAYGWGVTFDQELLATLYRNDARSAAEIEQAAVRLEDQVVDIQGKQERRLGGCYSVSRLHLLNILASRARGLGVHIKLGEDVTGLSRLPRADLIVACDGVNSRVRLESGRFQSTAREGLNKYAWLGTTRVFGSFEYIFARTSGGWLWAYAYGVGSQSSTFIVECPQETWVRLGFDIKPTDECLSCLEDIFASQLAGHQLAVQAGGRADIRWLNFRTVNVERWHDGNVVLAGDAAHTTHFAIGSGTKLAIEDVVALAQNLNSCGELGPAFQAYEVQRKAALQQAQTDAQLSAQWFENISRYIGLKPHEFAALLHARRSPLLPRFPPRVYYQIDRLSEELPILRTFRRKIAPAVKTLYSGRKAIGPSGNSSVHSQAEVD